MSFRKTIFWAHLVAGVVAGAVIGVMSFTGVTLAFEKEIIAWAERDLRRAAPAQADEARLPLQDLVARVREAKPEMRPSGITVYADPALAVTMSMGRTNSVYVNPYNGEIKSQGAEGWRAFLHTMNDWHRWLGREGDQRARGKAVTGACNVAFLVLAITGLYLWWPRQWTGKALRAISLVNIKARGKARDWNWHNAIGLWSAPVLIVLTATAMPISYKRAGDLIYKVTRSEPPAAGGPPGGAQPVVEVPAPPAGAQPLGLQAMLTAAAKEMPGWKQMTFRMGNGGRGAGGERRELGGGGATAVTVAIKAPGAGPRFATAQLSLDPFTGAVLRKETFGDYNLGRQVRAWTRFLHTGEALGIVGQTLAALASFGGLVLVWTGFALAARRFLAWRKSSGATGVQPGQNERIDLAAASVPATETSEPAI